MHAALTADPRKAHATKGRPQVAQEPAIHPGDADIHLLRDAVAALEIRRPDRGGKSVLGVVRHCNCLVFRIERRDVADRTEDLFFHAPRRLAQASIDCGLDIATVIQVVTEFRNASPGDDGCALFSSQLVVGKNFLSMLLRNEWSHLCGLLQGRAHPQSLRLALESFYKSIEDRAFHVNALGTQADLAGVEEDSLGDSDYCFFEITISEHDRRVLAAEFERYRFHRRRYRLHDGGAGL